MHPRLVCAAAALLSTALLGGCSSLTTEVAYPQEPVPGHCENWPDLEEVDRAKVQVSVLNNGAGAGAAATAARELEARGFTVLTTGNENEDAPGNAAIVRYGEMGLSAARTVAQQIEGAQLLRDSRRDPTVDVILGEQFEQLARQPAAQPDEVQMNVYNTTSTVGLAGDTADAMRGAASPSTRWATTQRGSGTPSAPPSSATARPASRWRAPSPRRCPMRC
ncbi:hypothetical protein BJF82_06020 [Kytococcus sp. CUA-901]|nr:hypothetical protein BJF82_06020 [Kytococcus sp. CUA-901]